MKIAITSQGQDLDAMMDQRFGRCPYVLIVDPDDMTFEAIRNPYAEESGGVGSRLASLIASQGVEAVLTEECGPHARDALRSANVSMVGVCADTVRKAIEAYQAGAVTPHHPAEADPDPAETKPDELVAGVRGRGRGRGHGGGRGRGGGGRGRRRRRREGRCPDE